LTTFTVATNEFIGHGKEKAEYHPVVTWARLAEIAGLYLGNGQKVAIEGRLQTRFWDPVAGPPGPPDYRPPRRTEYGPGILARPG
jgi:single-strand DNA-binding protein